MRALFRTATNAPIKGTHEQEAIWSYLQNRDEHLIVEAVAGAGKTTTIAEYIRREPDAKIGYVAFNKHIRDEFADRVNTRPNCSVLTYHGLGYRTLLQHFKGLQVDPHRLRKIVEGLKWAVRDHVAQNLYSPVKNLTSLLKSYGHGPFVDRDTMTTLAYEHSLDFAGYEDLVCEQTRAALKQSLQVEGFIDFDDQVWLPMQLNLKPTKWDVLCVDEYQDTNIAQQWLATRAAWRLFAVGDPMQAIYQFRGADSEAFDRLRRELAPRVETLPLTLTRRCPKNHVRFAQVLCPQIQSLPEARDGVVEIKTRDKAFTEIEPGDMVLCRVNADLVTAAYRLIQAGVPAIIRGRDIASNLIALVNLAEKKGANSIVGVLQIASKLIEDQNAKLRNMPDNRGGAQIVSNNDRLHCLYELATGVSTDVIQDLRDKIHAMFSDERPDNVVVCSTVHRAKGLESKRVWILRPDILPHPMGLKTPSGRQAEANIAYVAITRSLDKLFFIDKTPTYFEDLNMTHLESNHPPIDPPDMPEDPTIGLTNYRTPPLPDPDDPGPAEPPKGEPSNAWDFDF